MQPLNLPTYSFNLKKENNQELIYDNFRRKWLVNTPEEWVRQHIARYLVDEKKYPKGLVALEYQLKYNQQVKRCDIICFNNAGKPVLLVECKAPEVKISQKTFNQIVTYNYNFQVNYLLVTNGLNHYCCFIDRENNKCDFIGDIPSYSFINE